MQCKRGDEGGTQIYDMRKGALDEKEENEGWKSSKIRKKKLSNKDRWHNEKKIREAMFRIKARRGWRKAKGIKNNEEKWKRQNAEQRQDTHTHTWELMSCHFIKPTATPRVLTPLQSSLSPWLPRPDLLYLAILQTLHSPLWAIFLTSNYHHIWFVLSSQKVVIGNFFLLFLTSLVLLAFMSETKESEGTTHTIYEIIFF